jgi:MFS family permease
VASTTGDGVWARSRRPLTAGLVLAITLVGFEALAVATVMPDVEDDLGGVALYGWVFSAFFLGNVVGIVAAGHGADRHGPARPFAIGIALFAAGLLGAGSAPSMALLVAARAVQGLGAGAIPAIAYVAIGRAYPAELQARMFAVMSTAWVVPSVAGPSVSAAVSQALGWRWVFLGLLPLVAANAVTTTRSLRPLDHRSRDDHADHRAAALVLAVGAGLVLGAASSRSPLCAVPLAVAGAYLGGRAFTRLMPAGTLRLQRGMPAAVALRGVIAFAFFGADAFVTLTLTDVRGTSIAFGGLALTGAALAWTAGAWIQAHRVEAVGPRTFVRAGAATIACGVGGMILVANTSVPLAAAIVAWSLAGFGMGIAYAPLSLVVLADAPPGREGAASASLNLSETLGVALGTGASGAVVAAGDATGWAVATSLTIAFAMCGAIALAVSAAARRTPGALGKAVSSSEPPGSRARMPDEPLVPSLDAEGIPDHEGPLPEKARTGDAQEGLYPPAEDGYAGADEFGTTAEEQREGESLAAKLARETPDVGDAPA